jgi:signal transduction histidine kinase
LVGAVKGLVLIREGVVRTLLSDRVPELTRINGIVQTAAGETWLQGSKGLLRLTTADLERAFRDPRYRPPRAVLGFEDGIPDLYPNQSGRSLVQGGDGRLWFATLAGTAWIDPNGIRRDLSSPVPVITALHSRGKDLSDPVDVVLREGVGDVEINYTSPNLSVPQRQRFRYRLIGYDDAWVDAGARRQAFFTNLRPGEYRFEVLAVSAEGVWSRSPATVAFRVQPTFVQSRWFLALCAAAALLAVGLLYRFRLAQATRSMNRTLEVRNAERERIARELHDTLLQTVQGLILRFKAVTDRLPQNAPDRARLHDVLAQANSTMSEARDRVQGLRERLGSERLEEALAARVKGAGLESDVLVRVKLHGPERVLVPEVAAELVAIVDEALKNVAQHARATEVEVSLSYRREAVTLVVRDDGIGFNPAGGPPEGHFGLLGMAERAERIEGSLTVTARVGEGTTVYVVVPSRRAYPFRTLGDRLRGLLPVPA